MVSTGGLFPRILVELLNPNMRGAVEIPETTDNRSLTQSRQFRTWPEATLQPTAKMTSMSARGISRHDCRRENHHDNFHANKFVLSEVLLFWCTKHRRWVHQVGENELRRLARLVLRSARHSAERGICVFNWASFVWDLNQATQRPSRSSPRCLPP